jgi:hypothetical protein
MRNHKGEGEYWQTGHIEYKLIRAVMFHLLYFNLIATLGVARVVQGAIIL